MDRRRLKVLISHAYDERGLAEAWKVLLDNTASGAVETWFSSDMHPSGGIEIGEDWRDSIYENLAESDFIIAIQTPASTSRPWIMWECGVASGINKRRVIIPVVFSMERSGLANPLATYQVYQGDNTGQVREVCERLAAEAGLTPPAHVYEIPIAAYLERIKLHRPRSANRPEQMILWRSRFEDLIRSGRLNEIRAKRQAMYKSLGQPFHPIDPSLHDLLSRILLDQRNYPEAIEETDRALTLVENDVDLLHRKALALTELHNFPEAENLVDQILRVNDELRNNPELASLEGRIQRERWQSDGEKVHLDRAFDAYYRAYAADRTQYYPGINTGSLALIRGDISKAEEIFGEILKTCTLLQQDQVVSYWVDFSTGEACLGLGNVQDALLNYRLAFSRMPKPPPRDVQTALKGVRRVVQARGLDEASTKDIRRLLGED